HLVRLVRLLRLGQLVIHLVRLVRLLPLCQLVIHLGRFVRFLRLTGWRGLLLRFGWFSDLGCFGFTNRDRFGDRYSYVLDLGEDRVGAYHTGIAAGVRPEGGTGAWWGGRARA